MGNVEDIKRGLQIYDKLQYNMSNLKMKEWLSYIGYNQD